MTVAAADTGSIRALAREDLGAVVAIDAALEGRPRGAYVERRLAAALREPALHAQFAACDGGGRVVGHILARVLEGEFGRSEPVLRLEMVGLAPEARGHGTGQRLFDALAAWAARHGIGELRTTASWRDASLLHWLDGMRFQLAPAVIVDCAVEDGPQPEETEADVALPAPGELDFGSPEGNDFERRGRGGAEVRTMNAADLREIVRIDRSITGRDRSRYIEGRLKEALDDAAIRVSLTARLDGAIVGYLMARSDLGDFGRTAPVAVIDTLGVDSGYLRRGVGRAMLAQLFAHLGALQVERVETVLPLSDLAMLGFFADAGFAPAQRLPFVRRLR